MKNRLILMLSLVTFGLASADAAAIYLKDGSLIRGTIVSATARDVQVNGPLGLQTILTDRIARIDYTDTASEVPSTRESPQDPPQSQWRRVRFPPAAVWQEKQTQMFSFGLGAGIPFSQVDFGSVGGGRSTNGGVGIHFSPQYLFKAGPQLGAGFEMNYSNRSETMTQNLLPASDTWVSGHNLLLMPVVKYSFIEKGFGRPYILGGAGIQRSSTLIDAQPHVGFAWSDTNTDEPRTLVDEAHWGFGSTLRLGVDFSWIDSSVIGFEMGWTHLNNKAFGPTPAGKDLELAPVSGVQNNMVVAMRWGWRF